MKLRTCLTWSCEELVVIRTRSHFPFTYRLSFNRLRNVVSTFREVRRKVNAILVCLKREVVSTQNVVNINKSSSSSSSSLARQPCVGPGLPQKLLPAKVSSYFFFRFRDKSLFQGGVVSPTLSWRVSVFCQDCPLSWLVPILEYKQEGLETTNSPYFVTSFNSKLSSSQRYDIAQNYKFYTEWFSVFPKIT
jgi:hypothetical protein